MAYSPSPEHRLAVSAGQHRRWARSKDRTAEMAPAREAFEARWERMVDPDNELDPVTRAKAANNLRKAYFRELAIKSNKARRAKKAARLAEQGGE
jgi:hypothetical protein